MDNDIKHGKPGKGVKNMDKFENMKQNKVSDDDLDQVSGGRNLFDVFTAEFRGGKQNATTLEMNLDDEANNVTLSTLEMRANPLDKKTGSTGRKTIKL